MHEHNCSEFDWDDMYTGKVTDCAPPDAKVLELVEGLTPGVALDVGCGAGGLAVALAKKGWKVTGVDIAKKAIAAARKVVAEQVVDVELHAADAARWTPPRRYDLVTNTFALPMSKAKRSEVFAMIREALAPGGTVLLKDFDASMKAPAFIKSYEALTLEEVTEAFEGFEIVRAEIVDTPVHEHAGHAHAHERWTAALLHAKKPM